MRNKTVNEVEINNIDKKIVLYIEDNPANLRLVEQLLSHMDSVRMMGAPEPLMGLELAAVHKPDLILMDINLPTMDGYTALKRLRKMEELKNTPVLAISANVMAKDIEKGLAAGFDDYITKPINIHMLLKSVANILEKNT